MNLLTKLISKDQQDQESIEKKEKSSDFFCCFSAKTYFDIQQEEIFARIKSALLLKPVFRQVIDDKPDLYGPFWIATTLIIIIIASSSLIVFFSDGTSTYNFNEISVAACLIYGIAFGCPYAIAFVIKIFGGVVSVVDLICIYGYSLTAFIPITCFCFVDSHIIQLILLTIAFCTSSIFLIRGILSLAPQLAEKQKGVLAMFVLAAQVILVVMYKLYFFKLK